MSDKQEKKEKRKSRLTLKASWMLTFSGASASFATAVPSGGEIAPTFLQALPPKGERVMAILKKCVL